MKITFLGTSHGIPEPDRFCSSTLIQSGEKSYLIDAGAPISSLLRYYGVPHESVGGVFVTHFHGDHINGLLEFTDHCNWYFTGSNPAILLPDPKAVTAVQNWRLALAGDTPLRPFPVTAYSAGMIFDDGILRVEARPTRHIPHAYAFVLELEGKRLLFTGDLSARYAELPELHRNEEFDLVVCEAAHHDHYEDTETLFAGIRTKRLILNHMFPARNMAGALSLRGKLPFLYEIAFDGKTLQI